MGQQYLTIWDLILTPIFLLLLITLAKKQRDKHYPPGHPLRIYYLPGLYVKFVGAVFIALLYQYYYGSGDTMNFYYLGKLINSSLNDSFSSWIKILFRMSPSENPEIYEYVSQLYWYEDVPSYTVAQISAIFGLVNGTTYIPTALMFAYFAYSGMWAMFRTFVNIYPDLHKPLAIAFLFIPTTFVWGSAIFKDTICMFSLGWLTNTTFRIFVNKDFSFKNLSLLIISFYLIALIKIYILLAFLPALSLWVMMTYSRRIKSAGGRWLINGVFIAVAISGFLFFSQKYAKELNKYSLENLAKTAKVTSEWIMYVSENEGGSGYNLGEIDGTIGNMLAKFPQAVVVTLFRPFLWEVRKPIMFLSAAESAFFAYLFFVVFIRSGTRYWRMVFSNPDFLFFLAYSIIFAFAVGISTGNFGTLSRYKIPCMPFFAALLLILYNHRKTFNINQNRHVRIKEREVHHIA